jgi:hypothetical protein
MKNRNTMERNGEWKRDEEEKNGFFNGHIIATKKYKKKQLMYMPF